mmetsp:Transcript_32109/g.55406  ORF Transcript_32109/g.55406 Transcript_32109/m.55406 type:complete len:126 (+) Transcript_32109:2331-2708(+)
MATSLKPFDISLFQCFDNAIMCLFAWCVPCGGLCMQAIDAKVVLSEKEPNAAIIAYLCAWCLGAYGAGYNRYKIRDSLKVEGSYIVDCLLHCFCGVCAVTQEWQVVMKEKKGDPKRTICNFNEKK